MGRFDPKDAMVATGMTGAHACGDVMKLQIKLDDDERIVDVKFKTYGCGSAIASSTMFVDMLRGKTIEEAKQVKDKDIAEALELPPIKLHCSVLAEDSIKKAIEDWEKKEGAYSNTTIMYRYKVSVVKVVDGDTVDVDIDLGFGMSYKKQRVRMLGIDTPEIEQEI